VELKALGFRQKELVHLIVAESLSPAVLVKINLSLQYVGSNGNPELLCNSGFYLSRTKFCFEILNRSCAVA
jgi:hypothetical protein